LCTPARELGLLIQSSRLRAMSLSLHGLDLDGEVCDLRLHNFFVIAIPEFDCIGVRARFENDVLFLCQALVHIRWHTIKIAQRRDRTDRAVREESFELPFLVDLHCLAKYIPELFNFNLM